MTMALPTPPESPEPFDRFDSPSLRNWSPPDERIAQQMTSDVVLPMGWGRLIFGHTFASSESLVRCLLQEAPGQRDIALYLRDPHVVLALAPHELFLDPSHTYRLWLNEPQLNDRAPSGFRVRTTASAQDVRAMNCVYNARHMVPIDVSQVSTMRERGVVVWMVAEETGTGRIIGAITGVDHEAAFDDPEHGSSIWCLAVDPQAPQPGVGQALVEGMIRLFHKRGRAFVDLSVLHDNHEAIALYEKLGFERVPVFCVKKKNAINEPLFVGDSPESHLNPYARIIIDEARRRGILAQVLDEEGGYFRLHLGGRSVTCRESLTELTSAIAMSRCDDKRTTLRICKRAGLNVPDQQPAGSRAENLAFLDKHKRLVVKPARGEQGRGISVDLRDIDSVERAIESARQISHDVIIEQFCEGQDLRIIVIDYKVVAAAIRKPAEIIGSGRHTIRELIEKQSRRRAAATGGESKIPLDAETERVITAAGFTLDSILPFGQLLAVRKTANLHTGGTIHDVTPQLHPTLADAAIKAAAALEIPVTGLDLLVPDVAGDQYVIVEANERPGLANHEPQPTAERFIDFLFPYTRPSALFAQSAGNAQ
jgi:GNAT-family acetyltransferase (TIGR03103 family)